MLYGAETWATVYNKDTRRPDWSERDENATVDVRSYTQRKDQERTHTMDEILAHDSKKITERRLNWYGNVMKREEERILRKVLRTDNQVKGRQGDRKQDRKTCTNGKLKSKVQE